MRDLLRPRALIHLIAGRKILRQGQEVADSGGNVEIAALEQIAAANAVNLRDFGINGKNLGARKVVDGVIVQIMIADRHTGFHEQLARDVGEHEGFRMHDRIHEYAAPRPAHELGGKIEAIAGCIPQEFRGGGAPDVKIADGLEHIAVEERLRSLKFQADAEGEHRERRMIGAQRPVEHAVAARRIEQINEIGLKRRKIQRGKQLGVVEAAYQLLRIAALHDPGRKILGKNPVVSGERARELVDIGDCPADRRIVIDLRRRIEQLHRIGDAIALAIADDGDPGAGCGLRPAKLSEAGRDESADDLFVDLRKHRSEA